jgi:hypothetical protein
MNKELHGIVDRAAGRKAAALAATEIQSLASKKPDLIEQSKKGNAYDEWILSLGILFTLAYAATTYLAAQVLVSTQFDFPFLMSAALAALLVGIRKLNRCSSALRDAISAVETRNKFPKGFISTMDLLETGFSRGARRICLAGFLSLSVVVAAAAGLPKIYVLMVVTMSMLLMALGAIEIGCTLNRKPRLFSGWPSRSCVTVKSGQQ